MINSWVKTCQHLKQVVRVQHCQLTYAWRYKTFQTEKYAWLRCECKRLFDNLRATKSLVGSNIQFVL